MRPTSDQGWQAVDAAYAAVTPFPPRDQVAATAWAVVAVLSALREQSKDVDEARTTFNRTCDEALAYLTRQIVALRFPTMRGADRLRLTTGNRSVTVNPVGSRPHGDERRPGEVTSHRVRPRPAW